MMSLIQNSCNSPRVKNSAEIFACGIGNPGLRNPEFSSENPESG